MAEFKRVDDQQVNTIAVFDLDADGETYSVGSLIAYDITSKEISLVDDLSKAKLALDDGRLLYIIAQSNAVTEKTGTEYKHYDVSKFVTVSNDSANPSLLAAYRVDSIENVIL